jgi:hypothetical protein
MGWSLGVKFGRVGMHEENGLWGNMGEIGVLIGKLEEVVGSDYKGAL